MSGQQDDTHASPVQEESTAPAEEAPVDATPATGEPADDAPAAAADEGTAAADDDDKAAAAAEPELTVREQHVRRNAGKRERLGALRVTVAERRAGVAAQHEALDARREKCDIETTTVEEATAAAAERKAGLAAQLDELDDELEAHLPALARLSRLGAFVQRARDWLDRDAPGERVAEAAEHRRASDAAFLAEHLAPRVDSRRAQLGELEEERAKIRTNPESPMRQRLAAQSREGAPASTAPASPSSSKRAPASARQETFISRRHHRDPAKPVIPRRVLEQASRDSRYASHVQTAVRPPATDAEIPRLLAGVLEEKAESDATFAALSADWFDIQRKSTALRLALKGAEKATAVELNKLWLAAHKARREKQNMTEWNSKTVRVLSERTEALLGSPSPAPRASTGLIMGSPE
jgi:hypothetical protein